MLHHCVFSINLALGAFQNFMGQGSGEANHQIRVPQLVSEAPGRFDKYLSPALVLFTKILVLALHTFISAKDNHAHLSPLCLFLV
jgi:hypothetical protein